jgi:uncharacterized membrane protein
MTWIFTDDKIKCPGICGFRGFMGDIMNRFECIISGLIIGVIALALIFKAIGTAVKYIVNICAEMVDGVVGFFGLVPDLFWALAVMIFVTIGLIWLALRAYYLIVKERNHASIVQVKERRAFICREGNFTAVSFEGGEITTKQIERPCTLTSSEGKVLLKMRNRRRRIEHTKLRGIEYKSNVPIPGCHH